MGRTLPATWRLPRLPPPTLGGVSNVELVTLLGTLLLLRLAWVFVNWDGADTDVHRRAANSWIEHGNPYLYDGSSGTGTYRYAPWFAGLLVLVGAVPRDVLQIAWMAGPLIATAAIMVSLVRDHGWSGLPPAPLAGGLLTKQCGPAAMCNRSGSLRFLRHAPSLRSGVGRHSSVAEAGADPVCHPVDWTR